MSESPAWVQMTERGTLLGLRAVVACYRWFGRPLSVLLVNAIALYYFLTLPAARRASRAYLGRIASRPEGLAALGGRTGSWATFLHIRAFAMSILDRLVLWFGRKGDLEFEVTGTERCQSLLRPDRGAIIVGAHLGSFDALRVLADKDDLVVNVLMYTRNAERINSFLRELSPDAQVRVLQAGEGSVDTVLKIRACIGRGELVAILGDRVEPGDRGRSVRVPFLGDPVSLPEGPFFLAGLLGCPIFFMVALRVAPAFYRVHAEVLAERVKLARAERDKTIHEVATAYAGRLEHYCTLAPYEWFNFFDFWGDHASALDPRPPGRAGQGRTAQSSR